MVSREIWINMHSKPCYYLYQPCVVNLVTFLFIMTVSDLSEQPCRQFVPNLLQQLAELGTSSAKTACRKLVNRFVTTCLQTCNNLCIFTCVHEHTFVFPRNSSTGFSGSPLEYANVQRA
jgi:hypothetical protein